MFWLYVLAGLTAIAVAGTLYGGWRDGWLTQPVFGRSAERAQESRRACNYVAIAEIAKFPAVRRRIGYQAANAILRTLAGRILADGRCEVGRVGRTSVEFLYHARDAADALAAMTALRQALERPVVVEGMQFDPEVVIGSSPIVSGEADDGLFDLAAFAVEDACRRPERIGFAEAGALSETAAQSARMLPDLIAAIRADALEMHYLPKLSLTEQRVIGAEALCRWTHPRHGSVPPTVFIGLAEETGLIDDLTLRTLDRTIADQQRLLDHGIALAIDVNLSGRLVSNSPFCDVVMERIAAAPGRIGLEITETAVIEDPEAALANLHRIAAAGIHIAIDDFGSGLSSLSYLRDLPAQELKIDQAFIRKLTTSNRDPLLVRSAIEIARALEMEVTAEGVEDELALSLLTVMRCNNVQGFHISPPLPLDQLIAYLKNGAKLPTGELAELREKFTPRPAAA
jgi:EAL domain-containing protein (putative c-di-GMP-specific phosphodiesterase class I)/GGDEF domain-containing protein